MKKFILIAVALFISISYNATAQSPKDIFGGRLIPNGDGRYSAPMYYGKQAGQFGFDSKGYNSYRFNGSKIYSQNGSIYGSYNNGVYRDSSGFFNGYSRKSNGSTMYYDHRGSYIGRESSGRIYDRSGKMIGTKK